MGLGDVPAYAAYKRLGRIPRNASLFKFDGNQYPVVHTGELYCRMPGPNSGFCGHRVSKKGNLLLHLENCHDAPKESRPMGNSVRVQAFIQAKAFFEDIMKYEEYDRTITNNSSIRTRTQTRPRAKKILSSTQELRAETAETQEVEDENDSEELGSRLKEESLSPSADENARESSAETPVAAAATPYLNKDGEDGEEEEEPPTEVEDLNEQPQHQQQDVALQHRGAKRQRMEESPSVETPEADEMEVELDLEEAEAEMELKEARLRQIKLKRKLAALKRRKA